MARPYKATNKRIIMRQGNGRFRKATGADLGIGGVCPECHHFLMRHYDGDPRDRPADPGKFRYRCFTCEPKTEAESALEIEANQAVNGMVKTIEAAATKAAS